MSGVVYNGMKNRPKKFIQPFYNHIITPDENLSWDNIYDLDFNEIGEVIENDGDKYYRVESKTPMLYGLESTDKFEIHHNGETYLVKDLPGVISRSFDFTKPLLVSDDRMKEVLSMLCEHLSENIDGRVIVHSFEDYWIPNNGEVETTAKLVARGFILPS